MLIWSDTESGIKRPWIMTFLAAAFAAAAILANTFLATNPDHVAPIFRDTIVFLLLIMCALSSTKNDKLQFSKSEVRLIALIVIVVGSVFLRAIISVMNHDTQYADCSAVGGLLYQTECILYASAIGNASIRIATPHVFAFFIALTAGTIIKAQGNRTKCLLFIAVTTMVFFLAEELMGKSDSLRTLHTHLFGAPALHITRPMSGPFTNYGWAWPYLAPIAAISLWLFSGDHSRKVKATGAVLSLLCAWSFFANGQRGGVLTFVTCALITCVWVLWKTSFKKQLVQSKIKLFLTVTIVVSVATGIALLMLQENLSSLNTLTSHLGFTFRKLPFSASADRLKMWQFGFDMWQQHPFLGNGHGSWIWLSLEHASSLGKTRIFESAHNLYVQLFTELGLFHTCMILGIFSYAAWNIFSTVRREKSGYLLFFLLLVAFVFCTVVQEIDYIRTTYYQWAMILGIVGVKIPPAQNVIEIRKRWIAFFAVAFGAGVLFLNAIIGDGAFGFEPRPKNHPWPTWERWIEQDVRLVAPPGLYKNLGFTLFPIALTHQSPKEADNTYLRDSQLMVTGLNASDYIFSSIPGKSIGLSSQSTYLSYKHRIDSRVVAGRLNYPAFQSRVNIIWGRNIAVESNKGAFELQCRAPSCHILFGICRSEGVNPVFKHEEPTVNISTTRIGLPLDAGKNILAVSPDSGNAATLVTISGMTSGQIKLTDFNCE